MAHLSVECMTLLVEIGCICSFWKNNLSIILNDSSICEKQLSARMHGTYFCGKPCANSGKQRHQQNVKHLSI